VTEAPQAVTLALGRGTGDELRQPPRAAGRQLIDRSALVLMVIPAIAMALFTAVLLVWELDRGKDIEEARSSLLLALVLFENAFVLAMSREDGPAWLRSLSRNWWLLLGVVAALGLQVLAMTYAPLRELLGLSVPDRASVLACVLGAVITLIAAEVAKFIVRRARA